MEEKRMAFSEALKTRIRNVHTYVVTPFKDDASMTVDMEALVTNLQFLVTRGVQVAAMGGGTGECEALTPDEHVQITQAALETVGDPCLVVATVPGNMGIALHLLDEYERMGIEVVLAMPPLVRGKVPSDTSGLIDYFQTLCSHTSLPLMPYNTQEWTVELFCELAAIEGIIGIKDPCLNPYPLFQAIQQLGDQLLWIGNKRHDPGVLHLRFQMGIEAFTSGQTNFWPEPELQLFELAKVQDWDSMITLQKQCAPLEQLRLLNDDAAMVKAAMDLVGLKGGRVRAPRSDLNSQSRTELAKTLRELKVPGIA